MTDSEGNLKMDKETLDTVHSAFAAIASTISEDRMDEILDSDGDEILLLLTPQEKQVAKALAVAMDRFEKEGGSLFGGEEGYVLELPSGERTEPRKWDGTPSACN